MFFTHVGAAAPSSGLERATASADSRGTRDAGIRDESRRWRTRSKATRRPHHTIAATLASEPAPGTHQCAGDRPASAKPGGSVRPGRHEKRPPFLVEWSARGGVDPRPIRIQSGRRLRIRPFDARHADNNGDRLGRRVVRSVAQRVAVRRLAQDALLLLVPVALVPLFAAPLLLLVERLVLAVLALRGAAALRQLRRVVCRRLRFPSRRGLRLRCDACALCLLYTSPSPRDQRGSRMPSSA